MLRRTSCLLRGKLGVKDTANRQARVFVVVLEVGIIGSWTAGLSWGVGQSSDVLK